MGDGTGVGNTHGFCTGSDTVQVLVLCGAKGDALSVRQMQSPYVMLCRG